MPLWAVIKACSMAYLLGAVGLSITAGLWLLLRGSFAPSRRADAGFRMLLGAVLVNAALAGLIWGGVITRHISMTTNYFHSLMYGGWSLGITIGGMLVLLLSLVLAWHGWRRGRVHAAQHRETVENAGGLAVISSQRIATAGLVGVWKPEIWVNPQYWRSLSGVQREMLVFHERQHLRRQDNMRKLVLGFIASLYSLLPWLRRQPRTYELDCELAVDDICRAAYANQDYQELVLQALPAVEHASLSPVASRLSAADIALRLEVLKDRRRAGMTWLNLLLSAAVICASALPGLLLLQHPVLRCLLACYLGY